jgi:hypothetical protein
LSQKISLKTFQNRPIPSLKNLPTYKASHLQLINKTQTNSQAVRKKIQLRRKKTLKSKKKIGQILTRSQSFPQVTIKTQPTAVTLH